MAVPVTAGPVTAVDVWLEQFAAALDRRDPASAAALFEADGFWRDMLSFTWNIKTCQGRPAIQAMVVDQLAHSQPAGWQVHGAITDHVEGWQEAWLTFSTASGSGKAHVRVRDGLCYTLLTTLAELKDHPPRIGRNRDRGQTHGAERGKLTFTDRQRARETALGETVDPYCVIIGGGQGGMSLGARLKHLGVPYVILDRNARAGDSWRNRYPSLCLHDPVWYDHMPFIPFPADWPIFTPRDRMGDWLEMYARVMDLSYWTSSAATGARYDADAGQWTVSLTRDGEPKTLRTNHLVFATGMSGYPQIPNFAGRDVFAGAQLHSSAYRGGAVFAGKRAVVIGSNTSAHDICQDLWEEGADVTMVQRSGTLVASSEAVLANLLSPLYSEDALDRGIDPETADYIATTWPHRVVEQRMKAVCAAMREMDADLHRRLDAAGFLLDFGPDQTGLALKSIRQGGGFYINVGASELICDGDIKLESGCGVEGLSADAVHLTNGKRLPADVVIYATGYSSMNSFVGDLVGHDVADAVGRCWGVGSGISKDPGPWEGELRNMWKPTAHPALWFQGGNLAQSRHFSRFVAMQLKARMEGMPVQVFR